MEIKKSPMFYMGNKTRLMKEIKPMIPTNIHTFYDMFCGSGVVSMNIEAKQYILNDINKNTIRLLEVFKEMCPDRIINHIKDRVEEFDLSKTNKESFLKFKEFINTHNYIFDTDWILDCYTISFYSFSNMIRFSDNKLDGQVQFGRREFKYNVPFGKSKFSLGTHPKKIISGYEFFANNRTDLLSKCYKEIEGITTEDFVYLDPPYYGTDAIYNRKNGSNKGWTWDNEQELWEYCKHLDKQGIRFAVSNVIKNKGHTNQHIIDIVEEMGWTMKMLNINYSSNGKGSAKTQEVLVMNYKEEIDNETN